MLLSGFLNIEVYLVIDKNEVLTHISKLLRQVLAEVQASLVNYGDAGMSVMEMSHRGAQYNKIHNDTIQAVKELMYKKTFYCLKVLF